MGLSATLTKAVDKAFLAVGDLKRTAEVTLKETSGWDVATGKPIASTQTLSVDVILLTKTTADKSIETVDLIFKASQLPGNLSTTVTIDGISYKLIPPIVNNGYSVEVKAKKEK